MLGLQPPTVVLPTAVADATQAMLSAFTALDGNPMACELLPLAPGAEFDRLPGYVVRPFATFHPVPSQVQAPACMGSHGVTLNPTLVQDGGQGMARV